MRKILAMLRRSKPLLVIVTALALTQWAEARLRAQTEQVASDAADEEVVY